MSDDDTGPAVMRFATCPPWETRMPGTVGIGSKIGDYEIVSTLGRGGAGAVFGATNVATGQHVALKVLHAGHEMAEEVERRFVREISVAQSINSPYVVKYFDCGLGEDGVLYYTMEHVEWGSLKDVLKARGALPWRDAVECAVQIAYGLSAIHERNVIHRDLKPDNIFLSDDGRLKLGDFGLVRAIDMSRLTLDGTTVGTAKYLAPEQARALDVDARTDIYALGCNLFELIAGRPPFVGAGGTTGYADLMKQHVESAPPRLTDMVSTCPVAVAKLVDRMLAKLPDERPSSAAKVAEKLTEIVRESDRSEAVNQTSESDATSAGLLTERLRSQGPAPGEVNLKALAIVALVLIIGVVVAAATSAR